MKLGTLTITGKWPLSLDGCDLGYSPRKARRFTWDSEGFIKGGKLYKTQDPEVLIKAFGVLEAKYSLKVESYDEDKK